MSVKRQNFLNLNLNLNLLTLLLWHYYLFLLLLPLKLLSLLSPMISLDLHPQNHVCRPLFFLFSSTRLASSSVVLTKKKNTRLQICFPFLISLSENVANKMTKFGIGKLIKHTRTHLVRTYPKGTRLSSTNYEPHRFGAGGMQLIAINWQTFGKIRFPLFR